MALLLAVAKASAFAGETAVYFKSGWFTWDENVNGSSFVKEQGMMYGAGVARKNEVSALTVAELVEVWGGNLDYDGHSLTMAAPIDSSTSYLGTREEAALSMRLPVGQAVSVEPSVGIGHKFWVRTRSSEDWNTFYLKPGFGTEYRGKDWTVFAKGGALVPFYTRSHVSLSDAGYSDVVTEPEEQVSAFAEGGVSTGAFTVSVEYEGMKFGESKKVTTNRLANTGSGVVIIANQAYQPASSSTFLSLKLTYRF